MAAIKNTLSYLPIFSLAASVALAQTYTDQGLVGFASLPADSLDFLGDTLGGIGSAAAIAPGTFKKNSDGTYSGRLIAGPDRGHNTQGTVDYFGRHQYFDFQFDPFYGTTSGGAIGSFQPTYAGGLVYKDPGSANGRTTGLDPTGVRAASGNFPDLPIAGPNGAICLDQEGLAFLADGSFFASDEYGPYIYRISANGDILGAIQPPRAIVPLDADGNYYFTSASDPVTGRVANQGFEALTISPDQKSLYATLQSGTVQDGGSGDFRSRYTRMLHWDISNIAAPVLVAEYVVELPVSNKGQGRAQSEMYYLSETRFLLLARDGDGNGSGDPPVPANGDLKSKIKNIGYVDITGATNIANTAYDQPETPVAPGGTLVASITAAPWQEFIDLIEDDQLAKAGLHNGAPQLNDIVGKYESIALASVMEEESPEDYFVFSLADNDFITANGVQDGVPYADPYATGTGIDVPNQMLIFRVTLPGATIPSFINAPTLQPSFGARARARRAEGANRLPNTF